MYCVAKNENPNACPFVGGKAVFKARSLMDTRGGPSFYNDLEICNNQGIYKNGTSRLQQQIDMLQQAQKNRVLADNKLLVYPNPSNSRVSFEYRNEGKETYSFELMDLSGRVVYKGASDVSERKHTIDVSRYAQGIYMYKVWNENASYTGKIVVE